jgi:hypothetical protein
MSAKPSEVAAVLATIDPDAYTAAAYTSDWCDIGKFNKIMAIVMAGTLGTSATLDAKLQGATDSSGTGATDLTGKAITQLTEAGTDSDKQAIIEVDAAEVQGQNSAFTHVALVMTVATATSDCGAVLLGFEPRFGPANDNDLASVDEIVY